MAGFLLLSVGFVSGFFAGTFGMGRGVHMESIFSKPFESGSVRTLMLDVCIDKIRGELKSG